MNPYDYETFLNAMLARPERFIGPREELEQVLVRVSDDRPAAVLLVGPWGVGKSFLLQLLARNREVLQHFRAMLGPPFHAAPERLLFVLAPFGRRVGAPAAGTDGREAEHGSAAAAHVLEITRAARRRKACCVLQRLMSNSQKE